MAQIITDGITANAVDETKTRLTNATYLRSRNAANSADVNIVRVNSTNVIEFPTVPQIVGTPSLSSEIATVGYVTTQVGSVFVASYNKESFTLSATDITNQYIDLAQIAKAHTIDLVFNGLIQQEGLDYTVALTGGVGGKTRLTFAGDLATGGASELIDTDVLNVKYIY